MLQYMPLLYHEVSILPIGMGIDTSSGSLSNDMIVFTLMRMATRKVSYFCDILINSDTTAAQPNINDQSTLRYHQCNSD